MKELTEIFTRLARVKADVNDLFTNTVSLLIVVICRFGDEDKSDLAVEWAIQKLLLAKQNRYDMGKVTEAAQEDLEELLEAAKNDLQKTDQIH